MKRVVCGCLWWLVLWPVAGVHAGLLSEGTRVIYPADSNGRTLRIVNTNSWPVLVQPWVDQGEGDLEAANAPFVAMPAISRLEPSATGYLHILYTGEPLPEDRESLFWLNLYEIPPSDADADETRLTLTFNTQLKLFYRPKGLDAPDDLAAQLQFRLEHQHGSWCVLIWNPTPWHASIIALSVDATDGPLSVDEMDLLLPPFASRCYRLGEGMPDTGSAVHFSLIGDSGFSETYSGVFLPAPQTPVP